MTEQEKADAIIDAVVNGYEVLVLTDNDMTLLARSYGKDKINHVIIHESRAIAINTYIYHALVNGGIIKVH